MLNNVIQWWPSWIQNGKITSWLEIHSRSINAIYCLNCIIIAKNNFVAAVWV